MTMPLVSVVLPTKNRARTVGAAARSVLGQTHSRLELIVVDDGSTDDTRTVLEALGDGRLRLLALPESRGASGARNVGIEAARGDWIAFQDSDDRWMPDKLRRQVECALAHPGCIAVYTSYWRNDGTVLHMAAVASEFVPWQGLDRLLNGMLTYPGAVRLELVLIGAVPEKLKELVSRSNRRPGMAVHCPGPSYGPELDARLGSANLAIASLALFRKQMVQACPLKVREYMARGIPFVYGYNDPDVPEDSEFALKVPAEDQPVNMEEVIRFAVRSARSPDLACRMRSYAHDVMDWRGKVKALYALARQTAERARCR